MKSRCVIATMLIVIPTAAIPEVVESSATGNVQALAGKWKPGESFRHLIDSKLVSSGETGFEISIDRKLGDSHRKTSGTYFQDYSAFLKNNGHSAVASGNIKFDHGAEAEIVISSKDGSLYLWYGIVTGGNPRIFIGRGSDEASAETLVVEWASWCTESPVDVEREFATVIYERTDENDTRPRRVEKPANNRVNSSGESGKRFARPSIGWGT